MKISSLLYIVILLILISCQKDKNVCWQAYNPLGYDEQGLILCDKTKSEAEAEYPQFWFYKSGEEKFCWKVELNGYTSYAWDIPQSMAERQVKENAAYTFTKISCNSFCRVEWLEKHKSKITNQFNPTRVVVETFLSTDTCSKLSVGKIVVYRETNDSLITREIRRKNP